MQRSDLRTQISSLIKKVGPSIISSAISPLLRGRASVLCYHRITKLQYSGNYFCPNIDLCVRQDYFEEQIKYISQTTSTAPLEQIISSISDSKAAKHIVGISFDDGYRDNLELALPILEKYNVPATIFISTGLVDGSAALWWEELGFILNHSPEIAFEWDNLKYHFKIESVAAKNKLYLDLNKLFKELSIANQKKLLEILRPQCPHLFNSKDLLLSWDELKKLAQHPLISLGCHTVNHPVLSNETAEDAQREIKASREEISRRIGLTVNLLAYPFGGFSHAGSREFSLAEESGLKAAFTTRVGHIFNGHKSHLQCLPRLIIDYGDSLDAFKWKLSGLASFFHNCGKVFITD